jgi:hypothetical protein
VYIQLDVWKYLNTDKGETRHSNSSAAKGMLHIAAKGMLHIDPTRDRLHWTAR